MQLNDHKLARKENRPHRCVESVVWRTFDDELIKIHRTCMCVTGVCVCVRLLHLYSIILFFFFVRKVHGNSSCAGSFDCYAVAIVENPSYFVFIRTL